MRVGLDAIVTRNAIADRDDGAPLREARTGFAILHEPFAQAVEAFGDRLARRARQILGALVDLDARQHALGGQQLRKTRDRNSAVSGKSVSVRVDLGVSCIIKKKPKLINVPRRQLTSSLV